MSEKNKKVQNDSMRNSKASQRSNTPITTKPAEKKPAFTPPAQNVKKSSGN
jgi:hypothetical protein